MKGKKEQFSNRFAVIAAMAGSAIGLGNIWRFPYMVGENGGGAFVIVYLICSVFLALPCFFSEAILGRHSGTGIMGIMKSKFPEGKLNFLGVLCILSPVLILSFYSIVGGWSLEYLVKAIAGDFNSMSETESVRVFNDYSSSVWRPILTHFVFLNTTAVVVSLGVKKGIEKFNKIIMPVLFVLMVLIVVFSMSLPGAEAGLSYILKPDFSKIDADVICDALGQSFFSLSLGMGTILVYSTFMKKSESIIGSGMLTVVFDTAFAILAGLAIMPAVFSAGIGPSSGPGLVYETLPYIFSSMGTVSPTVGYLVPLLFFLAVLMAALTSEISMFEVFYEYLRYDRLYSKKKSILTVFFIGFLIGIPCSLSFGPLKDVTVWGLTLFDLADFTTSNFLMFIGSLLFCMIVGWKMKKEEVYMEITNNGEKKFAKLIFKPLYLWIRYVLPFGIIIIFLTNLFV